MYGWMTFDCNASQVIKKLKLRTAQLAECGLPEKVQIRLLKWQGTGPSSRGIATILFLGGAAIFLKHRSIELQVAQQLVWTHSHNRSQLQLVLSTTFCRSVFNKQKMLRKCFLGIYTAILLVCIANLIKKWGRKLLSIEATFGFCLLC